MFIFFYYFYFYHDTHEMKYTHFIKEEGELYRVFTFISITTVHPQPFGQPLTNTNQYNQSQLESSC